MLPAASEGGKTRHPPAGVLPSAPERPRAPVGQMRPAIRPPYAISRRRAPGGPHGPKEDRLNISTPPSAGGMKMFDKMLTSMMLLEHTINADNILEVHRPQGGRPSENGGGVPTVSQRHQRKIGPAPALFLSARRRGRFSTGPPAPPKKGD